MLLSRCCFVGPPVYDGNRGSPKLRWQQILAATATAPGDIFYGHNLDVFEVTIPRYNSIMMISNGWVAFSVYAKKL